MKLLSILLVALLVLMVQLAKAADMVEVVYLKNGSIIRGIIIEQIPGKSIKIQTEGGNVFVFAYEEIDKITKEQLATPRGASVSRSRSGDFTTIAKWGLMTGERTGMFSATTIGVAMLSEDVSMGLGVSYDDYPGGFMVPIFLDVRGGLAGGSIQPLVFADAGYSLGWITWSSGSHWGGFVLDAGLGISVPFPNSWAAFVVDIGYKRQDAKEIVWRYYGEETQRVTYEFFVLQAGFSF